jgi:hypothetical protein
MFRRARWRLTLLYIALFAIALGLFAAVFYAGFATVLAPDFDLGPELTNAQVAEAAYQATIERIGAALAIAWVIAVALVSVAAWVLAARTLRPIREAHLQQRRFVADASHEVRTPLAAIRATAEEATSHAGSPDELRAALARIADSAVSKRSRVSHFTCIVPKKPGVTRRTGPPCTAGIGSPVSLDFEATARACSTLSTTTDRSTPTRRNFMWWSALRSIRMPRV